MSGLLSDAELLALLERLDHESADALESQWLDFKDWEDAKSALKAACEYAVCFANAEGGTLVFGVSDRAVGRDRVIHGAKGFDVDVFRKVTLPSNSVSLNWTKDWLGAFVLPASFLRTASG